MYAASDAIECLLSRIQCGCVQGKDVDWSSALRAVPVHIVTPDTKFEKVLEALSVHKLHRVYVIDKTEKATGIITLDRHSPPGAPKG